MGDPTDISYSHDVATRALFDRFGIYSFAEYPGSGHTWRHNLWDFAARPRF
jgi:hypothetical protein